MGSCKPVRSKEYKHILPCDSNKMTLLRFMQYCMKRTFCAPGGGKMIEMSMFGPFTVFVIWIELFEYRIRMKLALLFIRFVSESKHFLSILTLFFAVLKE